MDDFEVKPQCPFCVADVCLPDCPRGSFPATALAIEGRFLLGNISGRVNTALGLMGDGLNRATVMEKLVRNLKMEEVYRVGDPVQGLYSSFESLNASVEVIQAEVDQYREQQGQLVLIVPRNGPPEIPQQLDDIEADDTVPFEFVSAFVHLGSNSCAFCGPAPPHAPLCPTVVGGEYTQQRLNAILGMFHGYYVRYRMIKAIESGGNAGDNIRRLIASWEWEQQMWANNGLEGPYGEYCNLYALNTQLKAELEEYQNGGAAQNIFPQGPGQYLLDLDDQNIGAGIFVEVMNLDYDYRDGGVGGGGGAGGGGGGGGGF